MDQHDQIPNYHSVDIQELKEQAIDNLDLFAALSMPEDAVCNYPPLFWQIWSVLCQALTSARDFTKFAIGLPRGHGKTMFIKLLIIWSILFTRKKFILVICASAELAENILADVADVLDSDNIQGVFGNWRANMEKDRQGFKKFTFNGRPIILKAVGAQTAMRGITVKNRRPDFMIFDDAQTRECAESIAESKSFRSWFRATALKAKDPFGCTFAYIGNMYPDMILDQNAFTCMLRNLQRSPEWTSIIVGGILEDGSALWEEVQPKEQLLAEFRDDMAAGTPEIFFSEVLNDPAAVNSMDMDFSKIIYKEPQAGEPHQGNFIIIDPSNDKKNSDATAIGYFEVYDAVPNLDDLYAESLSGPELVHKVLELAVAKHCSLIFVEAVAYQYSLCGWFDFVCEQIGLRDILIVPLYPKGMSKNSRILNMFRALVKADISLHPRVRSQVIAQISRFDKTKKDNVDDILDILAYSEQVMGNHTDLLIMEGLGEVLESGSSVYDLPPVRTETPDDVFF